MRRTVQAILAAFGIAVATPALATSSLECRGINQDVSVLLTLGNVPVLAVVNAVIETPTATFALNPQGSQRAIIVGQAFGDAHGIKVDFTDPNIEEILVSLRTVRGEGDKEVSEAGVLTIEQIETYPVVCEGR